MAAMVLMLKKVIMAVFISTNIIAVISWPPPLISQLFSPRLFKVVPFFHNLAVFVWIIYALLSCCELSLCSLARRQSDRVYIVGFDHNGLAYPFLPHIAAATTTGVSSFTVM